MKTKIYLSILFLSVVTSSFAQWTTSGTTVYKTNSSGNVGIGTTTPASKLDVEGGISIGSAYSGTTVAPFDGAIIQGKVGIGTNNPLNNLDVYGVSPVLLINGQGGGFGINTATLQIKAGTSVGSILTGYTAYSLYSGLHLSSTDVDLYASGNGIRFFTPQGITPTERFTLLNDGKVGIGNTSPAYTLDVAGTINASNILINGSPFAGGGTQWTTNGTHIYYQGAGNIGIGNTKSSPAYRVDVDGSVNATGFYINGAPIGATASPWVNVSTNINYTGAGNVGINASNPDFKLTVNGKIKCEELQVVVDVPADYVFEETYNLLPLAEVEKFIQQNKHLPGVHSADNLVQDGWNVGEMNNKLLEKVEELTLYMIELNKQNELLKARISQLEKSGK